jgi:hypothetical protein
MFRSRLHSTLRLLMAFSLSAAAPALAAPDVTAVSFTAQIEGRQGSSPDVGAEIRVQGTELINGTITLPGPVGPFPLSPDGADLVVGFDFANQAALDSAFGAGTYALSLNNGTITANIGYEARPAVPSPDISSPGADEVIAPGPVEVLFTACPVCNLSNDTTLGRLEDGAETELASEPLTESDTSWIPDDGMDVDLQLGEGGDFVAIIVHTAVREKNVAANDDDGGFPFSSVFIQSNSVDFETGFETPVGDFCLVVNLADPPAACGLVTDAMFSVFDTTGMISTTAAGLSVDYTIEVDSRGKITGEAMADLDDDTTLETTAPVKGKLKGKNGEAKQKVSMKLQNDGLAAKLKLTVKETLSGVLDSLVGTQKASGKLGGVKVKEDAPIAASPLPIPAQGWRVDFVLDGTRTVASATLTLEEGRSFPLVGTSKFNLAKNLSTLKLQTEDKGIKIQVKKLGLDAEASPKLTGADLGYRILGQKGKVSLP